MKRTISLMLALASVGSMGVSAIAANDTDNTMVISPAPSVVAEAQRQFIVNGKPMALDSYTTENGTLMVPVRALGEALGFTVTWNNFSVNINNGEMQSDLRIGRGEGLTILSGVFYALHIIATASAARGCSPVLLSFVQFAVAAVLSWVTAPFAAPAPEEIPPDVWLRLGYLCVMCTGLCFLLQTFGQKYTPPTTAALLLTLESVFGTLFSVAFYHEHLELRVIVGFALILVAILISETKLKFLRRRMA